MYTVKRPAHERIGTDGTRYMVAEETRTFHTGAGLLRWALNEGLMREWRDTYVDGQWRRLFDGQWIGSPDRPGSDYGMINPFCRWEFTREHRSAMQRAAQRYREIIHYLREVEPEWRPDTSVSESGEIHYADNSTELHEINKYGQKRYRTLVAPHGDVCF
jgi:hypothetical protein